MTISKLSSVALLAMSSIACAMDTNSTPIRDADYDAPILGLSSGHLQGEVGPARVDAAADPLAAYAGTESLRVMGAAQLPQRIAMLQMSARTDQVRFAPGVIEHFTLEDSDQMVLLGCVGQQLDVYDEFDAPADEVELVVEQAPGGLPGDVLVVLTGTWHAQGSAALPSGQVASLSFVLLR